jgi:phage shock protein E
MKKIVAVIAVLVALVVSGCGSSSTSAVSNVDSSGFQQAISQPGVVVIDVRTPDEFAAGHIAGAQNINVEDANFSTAIGTLDKQATYAVYCRSGRRSAVATDAMAQAGFTSLVNLNGGVADWTASGGQLVAGP